MFTSVIRLQKMSLFDLGFPASKEDKDGKKGQGKTPKDREETKKSYEQKRKREFLKKWLDEFDWLRYDDKLCSMFVLL